MTTDVLAFLRQVTHAQHVQLELKMEAQRSIFTPEGYHTYLLQMYQVYQAIEDAQEPFVAEMAPREMRWSSRSKLPWLKKDMVSLDSVLMAGTRRCPPTRCAFSLPNRFAAWGAAYVTEGSTLGGQLLFRQLAPTLKLPGDCKHRFWRGHQRETGSYWKTFLQQLTEVIGDEKAISQAALGATRAFDLFLAQPPPRNYP